MKKTIILFASLPLLVSCLKTVEIFDEANNLPSNEITLSTMVQRTKAIAEGTNVPTDNAIGFLPNFRSGTGSENMDSYNRFNLFGYHTGSGVWRSLDPENPIDVDGEDFDLESFEIPYNFSPVYWPAGDRVYMDYVAYSYSNILMAFSEVDDEKPIKVEPVADNPNRMSVRYECNLPFETLMPAENILHSFDVGACIEMLYFMRLLGYDTGISESLFNEFALGNILDKYGEAVSVIEEEDYDFSHTSYLEGDTVEAKLADAKDALNRGYWFYANFYPMTYKFMQDDFLYAHDRNVKNDNHGSVKASFNHAKAWVKVIINNQTRNDFLVRSIRFNDVKSNGTLVIDNSLSEFEAYWDFPQAPAATGANIDPYIPVGLGFTLPDVDDDDDDDPAGETYLPGLIPDWYLVPANCYGPALSVNKVVDTGSGLVTALEFKYLNGSNTFSLTNTDCTNMIGRLSGMMFPAQEPGKISIKLSCWNHLDDASFNAADDYNTQTLSMDEAMQAMGALGSEATREISLNLPRQTWKMGKVYVYVLTIGEDEITINPAVTDWEYANPIVGPEQTGMKTNDEPTEVFGNGDTSGWGF